MDLFSMLGGFGGSVFGYAIPFLFVLTIVVFFHELGHFLVARWAISSSGAGAASRS